jgi:RTX calcium-binding nonapeptide repeat (4 copies)
MARKIRLQLKLIGTDGDDTLIGSNRDDQPGDILEGGAGNDLLDAFQGADTMVGGSGADTFKIHSWASSNITYGEDTITDFSVGEGDQIDVANVKRYFDEDGDGVVETSRPVNFSDIELTPIPGGNNIRIPVWPGDTRWDVSLKCLGDTPIEASYRFAV